MKVYAVGAYGFGNFGDDYYVEVLRDRRPDLEWTVSGDPALYRPFHYDLTTIAGGGLLYNKIGPCGTSSLRHHFRYPAVAQWFDKRTAMLGTGVQGELGADAIAPYVPIMQAMDICTVRDRASADFLRGAGVGSVLECADLVYVSGGGAARRSLHPKPVLGVVASQPGAALAHPCYEGFESRISTALEQLEKDFDLHFFSFDDRHDTWLPESWPRRWAFTRFDRARPGSLRSFLEDLQGVDILLTTRYHGAVLSILNATPFVAVGAGGQKTARECESIGYPGFASYDASSEVFASAVRSAWDARIELAALLAEAAAEKRRLANRNFHLLRVSQTESDSFVPKAAGSLAASAGRTLVVWNAGDAFWPEAAAVLDRLGSFDCLRAPGPGLDHPGLESAIRLPAPALMHWQAFSEEVRTRLRDQYDDVVVCHGSENREGPRNLFEVAARAGRRVWNFALWRHTVDAVPGEDRLTLRCGDFPRVRVGSDAPVAAC